MNNEQGSNDGKHWGKHFRFWILLISAYLAVLCLAIYHRPQYAGYTDYFYFQLIPPTERLVPGQRAYVCLVVANDFPVDLPFYPDRFLRGQVTVGGKSCKFSLEAYDWRPTLIYPGSYDVLYYAFTVPQCSTGRATIAVIFDDAWSLQATVTLSPRTQEVAATGKVGVTPACMKARQLRPRPCLRTQLRQVGESKTTDRASARRYSHALPKRKSWS